MNDYLMNGFARNELKKYVREAENYRDNQRIVMEHHMELERSIANDNKQGKKARNIPYNYGFNGMDV